MSNRVVNGPAVRAIREAQRLGLREAAARIGVNRSHLSRVERGQANASPELVAALAEVLGVSDPAALTVAAA